MGFMVLNLKAIFGVVLKLPYHIEYFTSQTDKKKVGHYNNDIKGSWADIFFRILLSRKRSERILL